MEISFRSMGIPFCSMEISFHSIEVSFLSMEFFLSQGDAGYVATTNDMLKTEWETAQSIREGRGSGKPIRTRLAEVAQTSCDRTTLIDVLHDAYRSFVPAA